MMHEPKAFSLHKRPSRSTMMQGSKRNGDVELYYEMQQAREKDKERLKNDKTFWEFVKEGEDAMQIPEKEKIAASSFEKQKDFNNDEGFKRGIARNKLIPY